MIRSLIKREAVLCAALAAALASACFVPPSASYLSYIDFRVLALLFCLMLTVAGAKQAGAFDLITAGLLRRVHTTRSLTLALTAVCFFLSMLITNDVSLLTVVPLAVLTLSGETLLRAVVLLTAAANLGSMCTPIGNPQNLYLYSAFELSAGGFLKTMLPPTALSALALAALCLTVRPAPVSPPRQDRPIPLRPLLPWAALFLVCLACVVRVLDWRILLAAVSAAVFLLNRRLFARADYSLLATFVCFFIFVGNMKQLPQISGVLQSTVAGRELTAGILLSQIISNVPAAVLLSGFCTDPAALLVGVNLGGLGTPIASMASLISYKLYAASPDARRGRYMAVFLLANFGLLAVLWAVCGPLYG